MSCVLSRLPVHRGDKCYYLILDENKYDDIDYGPYQDFRPFCLPIEGVYNDYGRIEKVKKDIVVDALESFFEGDIDTILDGIGGFKSKPFYRSDSIVQKLYGKPELFAGYDITEDKVKKCGFTIDENGIIDHPIWAFHRKFNLEHPSSYHKEDPNIIFKVKDGKFIVEGLHSEPYEITELSRLCEYGEILEKQLSRFMFAADRLYIYGIPKAKHDKARILAGLTGCFINKQVYHSAIKIQKRAYTKYCKSYSNKETYHPENQEKKEFAEFKRVLDVARKITPFIEENLKDTRFSYLKDREGADLEWRLFDLRRGFLESYSYTRVFTRNLPASEFLDYLIIDNFSDELMKKLLEFRSFNSALYDTNTIVWESRCMEQHGDISQQIPYLKEFIKIGQKIVKNQDF